MSDFALLDSLKEFLEDEARSCSMDFGCVTPLYVYRMWGGSVAIDEIAARLMEIKKQKIMRLTYIIIAVLLLAAELLYFRIADKCNIIDKPNERSSHTTIVLRGGGIIFTLSMIAWAVLMVVQGNDIMPYLPFLCGLVLVAGISFVDDIHSLPDSLRMAVQIVSILLMFWSVELFKTEGRVPVSNGRGTGQWHQLKLRVL